MLTKLLPEQISTHWDIVKFAIEQSLPPTVGDHPDKINRILSSLLCGKTQCWVSHIKNEKSSKLEGIVLTQMIYDDASNTKNLLIYCMYGYEGFEDVSWFNGLKALVKYAKSRGCTKVVAYTDSPYITKIVNKLGGESKYTFISFNVNKFV